MTVPHTSVRYTDEHVTTAPPRRGGPAGTGRARDRSWLDIRILGPLRVTVDGAPATPPDDRTWRLLALLVVYADHVVPQHVMAEELWPDGPPPGATSEMYRRVGDLRCRLTPGGAYAARTVQAPPRAGTTGSVLESVSGGFRLACADATVDVRQFWRHAGAGLRALAADDLPVASHRLGSALRLWEGDALAGMELGPHLRRAVAQLTAERVRTEEERWETELRRQEAEPAPHIPWPDTPGDPRWASRRLPASFLGPPASHRGEAAGAPARRSRPVHQLWTTGPRPVRAGLATTVHGIAGTVAR